MCNLYNFGERLAATIGMALMQSGPRMYWGVDFSAFRNW